MTINELIEELNSYDRNSRVVIETYAEGSQSMCIYEVDIEVSPGTIFLSAGDEI